MLKSLPALSTLIFLAACTTPSTTLPASSSPSTSSIVTSNPTGAVPTRQEVEKEVRVRKLKLPAVNKVSASLPGVTPFETPAPLASINDGDIVLLDIEMRASAYPSVRFTDGQTRTLNGECDYGPVDHVTTVSIPTGSNHLLIETHLGNSSDHPVNSLACHYAPDISGAGIALNDNLPTMINLKGCYYASEISIPTARLITLAPLPGNACGLYR